MTNLVSHYGPIHTCLPRLDVLDCTEENKPLAACYPHPMIRSEYTEEALPSPYLFSKGIPEPRSARSAYSSY